MTKFILIFLLVIALNSCNKNEPDGIMIRIENSTSFTLDSVKLVYDITNYNFGTVVPGEVTEYMFFKSMPDAPAATADSTNKKILIGRLFPPNSYPYPELGSGKYTLQIFLDTTLFYKYNAKYIQN